MMMMMMMMMNEWMNEWDGDNKIVNYIEKN